MRWLPVLLVLFHYSSSAGTPTRAASRDPVIVQSSGPLSNQLKVGRSLKPGVVYRLRAGEQITVLDAQGSRILRGPREFRLGEPSREDNTVLDRGRHLLAVSERRPILTVVRAPPVALAGPMGVLPSPQFTIQKGVQMTGSMRQSLRVLARALNAPGYLTKQIGVQGFSGLKSGRMSKSDVAEIAAEMVKEDLVSQGIAPERIEILQTTKSKSVRQGNQIGVILSTRAELDENDGD